MNKYKEKIMKSLTTSGRIIFGLTFAVFGLLHFAAGSNMAGLVPAWVPGGVFWVYFTGLALLAGGVSLIADKLVFWSGLGLAVLMTIFVLTIHLPMVLSGGDMAQMAMPSLIKDVAMSGAAVFMAGLSKK